MNVFKILERDLPQGWVSRIAPHSLFWAFCVGSHGFAGIPFLTLVKLRLTLDLLILEHTLDGCIHVLDVDILAVLTEKGSKPIRRRITWLGHKAQGIKLVRTVDGRGLLSKGSSNDAIAWGIDNYGAIRLRTNLPFEPPCLYLTLLAGNFNALKFELNFQVNSV